MRCKPWNIGGKCIATKDMRKLRIYIYFLSVSDICHFPIASLAKRYNTRHDTNSSIAEKFPLTPFFLWYIDEFVLFCLHDTAFNEQLRAFYLFKADEIVQ